MKSMTSYASEIKKIVFITVLLSSLSIVGEQQPRPPWMQEDVLRAALEMGMTAEQRPHFQTALTNYLVGLNKAIKKLLRRNPTGLPREIKRKQTALRKRMDKEMAEFLLEEQIPGYEKYRDLLISRMGKGRAVSGNASNQTPSSTSSY